MEKTKLINIIEAILFVAVKPVTSTKLADVIELEDQEDKTKVQIIDELMNELIEKYNDNIFSFQLIKVAGGYQFVTKKEYSPWIKKIYKSKFTIRLSQSALETLSIIAYKQPITKAELEDIRGIDSLGVLNTLLARKLIKVAGYKDTLRKPPMYATTIDFLRYFGMNSLEELPLPEHINLEEIENSNDTVEEISDDVMIVKNEYVEEEKEDYTNYEDSNVDINNNDDDLEKVSVDEDSQDTDDDSLKE